MKQLSIANTLYFTMAAIGLMFLTATLTYSYFHEKQLIRQMASAQSQALASSYFESMNTLMISGAMEHKALLTKKMLSQKHVESIHMIRSNSVSSIFGEGDYPAKLFDALDQRAIQGESIEEYQDQKGKPELVVLLPITMTQDHDGVNCLSCHATSKEGDIGGAVRLHYSLADAEQQIYQSLWRQGVMLSLLFFAGITVLFLVFRNSVVKRLNTLRAKL